MLGLGWRVKTVMLDGIRGNHYIVYKSTMTSSISDQDICHSYIQATIINKNLSTSHEGPNATFEMYTFCTRRECSSVFLHSGGHVIVGLV